MLSYEKYGGHHYWPPEISSCLVVRLTQHKLAIAQSWITWQADSQHLQNEKSAMSALMFVREDFLSAWSCPILSGFQDCTVYTYRFFEDFDLVSLAICFLALTSANFFFLQLILNLFDYSSLINTLNLQSHTYLCSLLCINTRAKFSLVFDGTSSHIHS